MRPKGNLFNRIRRRPKSQKDYLLALDIGTEFVKALVLKIEKGVSEDFSKGGRGLVVGVARIRQRVNQMQGGAVADIEGVALTCQKAIEKAVGQAKARPTQVVIGIAGEFIKGSTNNFIYQRSEPEKEIGLVEIKNIIQKIQWKALDGMRANLAKETGRPEIEIRLINALVTDIKIDGYKVVNPLGFQGKEVFLNIFNVYAPLVHLRAIESIANKLDLELISIIAEPYALTKSSSYNSTTGAIFVDVGGGTTDIALVRRGALEGIKSFALAGRTFTRRLSQNLDVGLNEAEAVKIRHSQGGVGQNVRRKLRDILKGDAKIWLAGIELILEDFNQGFNEDEEADSKALFFPPLILLCGGGSILPELRSVLKKEIIQESWLKKFPFSQPPKVRFIQPGQITNIVDQTGLLVGPEDITPLALASLSLEIVSEEDKIIPPILRRMVRMMKRP